MQVDLLVQEQQCALADQQGMVVSKPSIGVIGVSNEAHLSFQRLPLSHHRSFYAEG